MIDPENISTTRWLGLLGFSFAALACAWAGRRRPAPWRGLALLHVAYLVEIALGLRHRVHGMADGLLQTHGWYGRHESLQVILLVGLGTVALAGARLLGLRARRLGAAAASAAGASGALGAMLLLEIVSLHAVDAAMYTRIHGILAVAIGWALGGAVVGVCALLDRRA